MLEIVAKPHIMRSELYRAEAPAGTTLNDLISGVEGVSVTVNGKPCPPERWGEPLADGALVNITAVPQGDNALRTVAFIAIAIIAAWAGNYAASAQSASAAAGGATASAATASGLAVGAAVSVAVSVVGSLAVNALIPLKMPSGPSSGSSRVSQSITGTRNQTNPYGVVPRAYGKPRWFPPFAALPVTEISGNDQYMRGLLCLGYGPLSIGGQIASSSNTLTNESGVTAGAIQIGGTNIEDYEDVEWEIGTFENLTLFKRDIVEQAVGAALNFQGGNNDDGTHIDNVSTTRTTSSGTTEISLDLVAPAGLFSIQKSNGKTRFVDVVFKIEYSPVGAGTWTTAFNESINSKTKHTLRKNYRWTVDAGQYDVRVTRVQTTIDGDAAQIIAEFTWAVLRSIRPDDAYTGNHLLMAFRIRATDQLNGIVDQLSLQTEAVLRAWDGDAFTTAAATSNPAWAYLDALTGAQVGRPVADAKINLDALKDWADWCDTQGLHYSWVHDTAETVFDRLRSIAVAGQASFAQQDGLFTIVRDDPDAALTQVVTPRNASGFQSNRSYKSLPHGLRVKYVDPTTWSDAERIVYRDGFSEANATIFEDLQTQGVASADEAWHHGNYFFRQAILRPEQHLATMDWENLACVRGNRVRLAYDVISVGLSWGRIKEITLNEDGDATQIALDEKVAFESGVDYGVRVRKQDGTHVTETVSSGEGALGQTNVLLFANPVGGLTVDDLVLFGKSDLESIECKVLKIEPSADFGANLTLVDAATDIYDFDAAPVFDPGITTATPLDKIPPPTPSVTLRGDETALVQDIDGSLRVAVLAAYSFPVKVSLPALQVETRFRVSTTEQWQSAGVSAPSGSVSILDVEVGTTYDVQVRALNGGVASAWSTVQAILVTGKTNPPQGVLDFRGSQNGPNTIFRWEQVTDLDLNGYRLRYMSQNASFDWDLARELTNVTRGTQVTSALLPPGEWFVGIKAVDTSGNESTDAAVTSVQVINRNDAIYETAQAPDWDGTLESFEVNIDDALVLTSGLAEDATAIYTAPFIDIGFVDSVRAWSVVAASAGFGDTADPVVEIRWSTGFTDAELAWDRDSDGDVDATDDAALFWTGTPIDAAWQSWSDWQAWTVGEVRAQLIQMRIKRPVADGDITITDFTPVVDIPPKTLARSLVAVSASGETILFDPQFHTTPVVTATSREANTSAVVTNETALGFDVTVYDNSTNSAVAGTINWSASTE